MSGFRKRGPAADIEVKATPAKAAAKPAKTASKFQKYGAVLEKKDGGVYIKLDSNFTGELTLNGQPVKSFQLEDPTAKFDRMVNAGKMTDAEADEAASKVPAYVLYEVQIVLE